MFKSVVFRYGERVWPCFCTNSRNYVQNAGKRISQLHTAPYLPLTAKTACVVGFALTASHPSVLETYETIKKRLMSRRVWAGLHSNHLPPLYVHQQLVGGGVGVPSTSLYLSCLHHFRKYVRAIYLAVLFSPTIAMSPFIDTFGLQFRKLWLLLLARSLEKAGPAFIAWGRWAATRPDLFPKDMCIQLSKIQNKVQDHSFSYTLKTIEKAFGRKLPEIFDRFQVEPIASGVFSQLYQANLRFHYPGKKIMPTPVVIKVMHPGVKESCKMDFAILRQFAKCLKFIPSLKGLKLEESLDQFEASVSSEVDLSKRAARLDQFNRNLGSWKDMSYPKPLYPLVHPAILVETYEEGEFLSRYVDGEIELEDRIKKNIVLAATRAVLKMLVVNDIIHSMHPENILVRVNKEDYYHIAFLDVSVTAEYSKDDFINFVNLFEAVCTRNRASVAECTLKLSKSQTCPHRKAFIEDLEESFHFWDSEENYLVSSLECMQRLLEKVQTHNVSINQNFSTMITSVLSIEEWQRRLCPDSRQTVMQGIYPFRLPWTASGQRFLKPH